MQASASLKYLARLENNELMTDNNICWWKFLGNRSLDLVGRKPVFNAISKNLIRL